MRTYCLSFLLVLFTVTPVLADVGTERVAEGVAVRWLALIDAREYQKAFRRTAPLFRGSIEQTAWVEGLNAVRGPLGEVEHRRLQDLLATSALPDAPEGDYVVVRFRTVFTEGEVPFDEIVIMVGSQGALATAGFNVGGKKHWDVIGYYLH